MKQASKNDNSCFYETHIRKFRLSGNQASGCCPFHQDNEASWSGNMETGQWKCHSGSCGKKGNAIIFAELMNIPKTLVPGWESNVHPPKKTIEAVYDYKLSNGRLIYQAVRMFPKSFYQRRPDPDDSGKWINNLKGVELVPYRLPELLDTLVQSVNPTIYIPEGEKDVDNLRSIGLTAICNPMGAGKWRDQFSDYLKGAEVVVIADKDEAGRQHASVVAESLQRNGIPVKVLELPGACKDVSDWIENRRNVDVDGVRAELLTLVAQTPLWTNLFQVSPLYTEKNETETKRGRDLITTSLATFMASGSSEITWVIDSICPDTSATILGGPPGKGKSWMLLDLAIEISRGGLWLGKFQAKQGMVLYIDEESSEVLLRKRFKKLLNGKGIDSEGQNIELSIGNGICLTQPEWMDKLREKLSQINPLVVIIDSLVRVHGMKENDATEMAQFFSGVKGLIRDFQCSIIFADHLNKNSNHSQGSDQLLRGSSEKTAFVDTLLLLHSNEEGIVITHAKSRYAEALPSFVVRIEDLNESSTQVNYIGEAQKIKKENHQKIAREFLIGLVGQEWILRKELVEAAKGEEISVKALDDALDSMVYERIFEQGEAEKSGKGRKPAQYRKMPGSFNLFHSQPVDGEETETNTLNSRELAAIPSRREEIVIGVEA